MLGTRLLVREPSYVDVTAEVDVAVGVGADPDRVATEVAAALRGFLDPLHGGPRGRGWPFGRSVYRGDVLQVVDAVPGIDYVVSLTVRADGASCGDVRVGPAALVASGAHVVNVIASNPRRKP